MSDSCDELLHAKKELWKKIYAKPSSSQVLRNVPPRCGPGDEAIYGKTFRTNTSRELVSQAIVAGPDMHGLQGGTVPSEDKGELHKQAR